MALKKIPKRFTDLLHFSLYILILLLFANYESTRKTPSDRLSNPVTPILSSAERQ